MKIQREEIVFLSKTKDYEIELDNGQIVEVVKWWKEDNSGDYDCDYEIAESNITSKLTENQDDDLRSFINELK